MKLKFLIFTALIALVSFANAKNTTCSLDGTYIRENTIDWKRSQVLKITGSKVIVFDQGLKRDSLGYLVGPPKFLGKPENVNLYDVSKKPDLQGMVSFDLTESIAKTSGYSGFAKDCQTGNLDHPSIGGWTRI